jgi:phytoene dehydrogenase-like protein
MVEYDVVIIGAGIGGLISGAFLTQRGYKVLVLEKNSFTGGCCSSFNRKGFKFDACVHWFSGCGPGSFIEKLHKRLGVNIEFKKYEPMDRIHYTDRTIEIPDDISVYQNMLIDMYPHEKSGILSLFSEMEQMNRLMVPSLDEEEQKQKEEEYKEHFRVTYDELLNKYIRTKSLKAILSAEWGFVGSFPNEASAMGMASMMYTYYKSGAYYPKGGAQAFPDSLSEIIESHGGKVLTKAEVVSICVEDNTVQKVVLKSGDEFFARLFISNADAKHTVNRLMKDSEVKTAQWSKFRSQINNMKESMSMYIMYLGLNISSSVLADKVGWYCTGSFKELDEDSSVPYYSSGYLVNVPSCLDKTICPEDKSILILYTDMPENDSEENPNWAELRERYEKRCLSFINDRILKDVEKYIEVKVTATPHSITHFTNNSKGSAYGWAMIPSQMGSARMQIQSPIDIFCLPDTGQYLVVV